MQFLLAILFFFIICSWHISHCQNKQEWKKIMADFAGFYGPCNRNYGRFYLSFFFAKLRCEVFAGSVFCHSRRLTLVIWTILSFCLGSTQSPNPFNTTIINSHHSTIHQTNRRSTQSLKSVQERKKREEQWDTDRYSHWYRMIELNLMLVLFGYITSNNNQQNSITRRRWWCIADGAMSSCTLTYVLVYVFVLAHKQTNSNTTHRHRK